MFDSISVLAGAHIASGAIAIAAGAVAFAARKGAPLHVGAGRVFAATMIVSSGLGAVWGLISLDDFYITFHAGILGVTLIMSSWLTARKRGKPSGPASLAVSVINLLNLAGLVAAGSYALSSPDQAFLGFHAANYFFLASLTGLAALGDIRILLTQSLRDRHRIARHLWRMGLAFFIAAGSAFTGPGASAFPEPVQASGILAAPELIILALIVFWLAHTLFRSPSMTKEGAQ